MNETSGADHKPKRLTPWLALWLIVAGLLFVVAGFYLEENWRGNFVWRRTKAELQAKGEILDWEHYLRTPPPDERNMMKVPGMELTFIKGHTGGLIIPSVPAQNISRSNHIRFGEIEVVVAQNTSLTSLEKLRTNATSQQQLMRAFTGRGVDAPPGIFLSERKRGGEVKRVSISSRDPIGAKELVKKDGIFKSLPARVDQLSTNLFALSIEQGRWFSAEEYIAWSAGQSNLFAMLDEAAARPECWLPGDYSVPFSVPIANFVAVRSAAQLLGSRAQAFLLLHRPDEAYADLQRIDTLHRIVTSKPVTLVSAMIHVAVTGLEVSVISDGFAMGEWREPHWRGFVESYSNRQLFPQLVESIRSGERAGVLRLIEQMSTDDGARAAAQDPSLKSIAAFFRSAPSGWASLNAACYARIVQQQIELFDGKTFINPQNIKGLNDQIIAEVENSRSPTRMIGGIAVVNIYRAGQTTAKNQTAINQLLVASALELYRKENGQYPQTLAELSPKFLSGVPHDIILGKPLRYQKRRNGEYALYSVGWNVADDVAPLLANPETPMLEILESKAAADDWIWKGVPENALK
jgi:hypothetical protein